MERTVRGEIQISGEDILDRLSDLIADLRDDYIMDSFGGVMPDITDWTLDEIPRPEWNGSQLTLVYDFTAVVDVRYCGFTVSLWAEDPKTGRTVDYPDETFADEGQAVEHAKGIVEQMGPQATAKIFDADMEAIYTVHCWRGRAWVNRL